MVLTFDSPIKRVKKLMLKNTTLSMLRVSYFKKLHPSAVIKSMNENNRLNGYKYCVMNSKSEQKIKAG